MMARFGGAGFGPLSGGYPESTREKDPMTENELPEEASATVPDDQDDELRQSSDPDPYPGSDTSPDRPAGLGEPAEDPDPPVSGTP